ncbi:hypothetical protein WJX82_003485 [Trebouxia sp. C0006]
MDLWSADTTCSSRPLIVHAALQQDRVILSRIQGMKFNQLYASFPKILETLATPFSGRKRKRDQAEIVEDSLSARPKKQSQTAAHPSGALAEAPSHHSNTRKAAAPAITQASLQQPADPYREATSQSAQAAYSSAKTRPVKDTPLQRYPLSNQAANAQLPSQEAYNREQDLQRRLEATEKQLAVMQQQFDEFRRNPAGKHHTVEGATISLKERDQYEKLVDMNKTRDAQNALQHGNMQHSEAEPSSPIRASSDPNDRRLDELMDALKMHKPYRPQEEISKPKPVAASTAEDLDEVCARARKATAAASQEALHAATQQAESMVQHKARMRQSHIAAQTPLPQQGAKAAPTEAQQRLSTAAEPKRRGKGRKGAAQDASSLSSPLHKPSRSWRQAEEEEQTGEASSGEYGEEEDGSVEEEEDGYGEEEDEEDVSAEGSSDQSESQLSAAFNELHHRAGKLEPVQKPTRAMLELKEKAFAAGPAEEKLVVHVHSGVDIARKDIRTLKSRQWLNDEVMNVYMGLLQERDTRLRKLGRFPKCHFFNTFFINKLYKDDKKYVYNNVRRWTTKMRLERWGQHSGTVLECDKLIIPVHLGCHWTCAVISLRDRGISYFDSLGGKEHEIVESLAKYVTDEYDNKLKEKVDTSDWSRRSPDDIPKQLNGCDCGVFALMFAEYQSRDAPFTFDQRHMEYFRVKVPQLEYMYSRCAGASPSLVEAETVRPQQSPVSSATSRGQSA